MNWFRPLLLTLQLMGMVAVVSATWGMLLAMCLAFVPGRTRPGRLTRRYALAGIIVCLATPLVLHAAVWEATAGKFGWMTFSQTAARTYAGLAGQFSGILATAWIHGVYGAGIVALATWYGTSRVEASVIDQSRLDGGLLWSWWRVRLPIAMPWVVAGVLASSLLAATEMTVVNLYGVRTLADEFYLFYAAAPSSVAVVMMLVMPSAILITAICVWAVSRRRRVETPLYDAAARRTAGAEPAESTPWLSRVSMLGAFVLSTMLFAFPAAGLILKAGQHVTVPQDGDGRAVAGWSVEHCWDLIGSAPTEFAREYAWTAVLMIGTVVVCVPPAWVLASLGRTRVKFRTAIDLLSLILVLIPGPLVGLAVIAWFQLPLPGFRLLYHQTIVPTLLALSARALPISYWILRTGYAGVDQAVLDVSRIDLPWLRRMLRVDRVLLARPLIMAAFAAGLSAGGDVPATLPVIPPEVVTVGTRLFALLHSGARNQEAALAFWYVAATVLAALAWSVCWKPHHR